MKKVNRVEEYCQTTFNSLGANVHNWGKPEYIRPLTRLFYVGVFDCGNPYPTGLISENALNNKSNKQKTVLPIEFQRRSPPAYALYSASLDVGP